MAENIGLVWLKDDFRLKKNLALIEATKENDKVVVFFLLKKKNLMNKKLKSGGFVSPFKYLESN